MLPPNRNVGGFFMWSMQENLKAKVYSAVVETVAADLLTPLAVYLKLSGMNANSFLLESVEGGTNVARYSFIGVDPRSGVRGKSAFVEVFDRETSEVRKQTLFDFLRTYFAGLSVEADNDLPPFLGGAIGFFGFDCVEWFESGLRTENTELAISEFMIFDSVVAFDHVMQQIKIITLSLVDGSDKNELAKARNLANARNSSIRTILESGMIKLPLEEINTAGSAVTSNWSQHDFEAAVRHVKELIDRGECYQVVLSQRFCRKTNASPISIYRALRTINPSPYMFLLHFGTRAIIGASPEMLVRSRGNRLDYRPIAGTRPRGKNTFEDEQFSKEMSCDVKEIAEHIMLVDLGRNDLGRVAKYGTVKVDRMMKVEKFSHVQHLVSEISAELAEGFDRFDAFGACFPAGTVSGAPKVRAIEIIRRLEPTPRNVYAGAVGYFDHAGNMDTCIAIRTLVLENGVATVQAGAGIVADSVPELEFMETVNKAAALFKAIDLAEAGVK